MIVAEIMKENHTYSLEYAGDVTVSGAYEHAKKVAIGEENFVTDKGVIDLGASKEYQHIKIYTVEDPVQVEPPAPPKAIDEEGGGFVQAFYDKVTFLGSTVEVRAVKGRADGVDFILVYEVNSSPALMVLSKYNLEKLAYHIGEVQGMKYPSVVLQPGDLADIEDAVEYLADFIKETKAAADNLPKEDLTAVAFPSFNENKKGAKDK